MSSRVQEVMELAQELAELALAKAPRREAETVLSIAARLVSAVVRIEDADELRAVVAAAEASAAGQAESRVGE